KYVKDSYAKALIAMTADGAPQDGRPSEQQIKSQRRQAQNEREAKEAKCTAECIGSAFIFTDHRIVSPDKVRAPFTVASMEQLFGALKLESFLMDFTFCTNKERLVLGASGPVGLRVKDPFSLPQMRFVPVIFIVADREDEGAQRLFARLYFEMAAKHGITITDGFLDCACFKGACAEVDAFSTRELTSGLKLRKKDEVTGRRRLQDPELQEIIDWVDFSARAPDDLEFHVFWGSILSHMESAEGGHYWGEPAMARYLRKHILGTEGPSIRATWASGLGAAPPGFTTYAPNAIQLPAARLLPANYKRGGVAQLIADAAKALQARAQGGARSSLVGRLAKAPGALTNWPKKKAGGAAEGRSSVETQSQGNSARLDLNAILAHYRGKPATHAHWVRPCSKLLPARDTARAVYATPKYQLAYATQKTAYMQSALPLSLATSAAEIHAACASKETSAYDIMRHMWLRHHCATIYVTTSGVAVDCHEHSVEGGGFSEHQVFIQGLQKRDWLARMARGPETSKSKGSKWHGGRAKQKRSEALKTKLQAPPPPAGPGGPVDQRRKGNFCTRYFTEAQGEKAKGDMFAWLKFALEQTAKAEKERRAAAARESDGVAAREADEVAKAKALSLAEMDKAAKHRQMLENRVDPRLQALGLQRVPADGDGNCKSAAIMHASGLDVFALELRLQIVNAMEDFPGIFEGFHEFDNYQSYLDYMRVPGTAWGDHLTLSAAAFLLTRPIRIVSDAANDACSTYTIEPPPIMSE
ncbi:unnamed protein product, partial [Prorocentrum cordatum]